MIYLDHNATAPMRPEAIDAVVAASVTAVNPSSLHQGGQQARRALDEAREAVRQLVGAAGSTRVVLTSGGTEADNLAIIGLARRGRNRTGAARVMLSDFEHPAVVAAAKVLQEDGFELAKVPVRADGRIDVDRLGPLEGVAVAALMLANNETGIVQPVAEVAQKTRRKGVLLHVDAVQAAGKMPIDFETLGADSLAISAHKFGGPRGIGALVLCAGIEPEPLWGGGGQEFGVRPGSPAVALAVGMAAAAQAAADPRAHEAIAGLRDELEAQLSTVPGAFVIGTGVTGTGVTGTGVTGTGTPRLPNTCAIGFEGVAAQALVAQVGTAGVLIGAGAACHGDEVRVSTVLEAAGMEPARALEVVRISLGWTTTPAEVERAVEVIRAATEELRR